MKFVRFSLAAVLLFLASSSCSLIEPQALTQLDKERFDHAVDVFDSVTALLEIMNFATWISKMTSVVMPVLGGVSIALDIALYFMDIPTPEMIHLQSKFQTMNHRLDTFSIQFEEVKSKIDWAAVQMSYEKYETIVRVFARQQADVFAAKTAEELELRKADFIWRFEHNFEMAVEVLFHAMTNGSSISDNVFEAAAKYTDRHPESTFRFMQGCSQLLLQAMMVKSTYIHLKYNSTTADGYFKFLASELMKSVAVNSKAVYERLQRDFASQLPIDVRRFAVANRGIDHKRFSSLLFQHLKHKYVNRYWFVLSFSDKEDDKEYAVAVCNGFVTHMSGRKVAVASQDKQFGDRESGWSVSWAGRLLNEIKRFKGKHYRANALLQRVLGRNQSCKPAAAVAVLKIQPGHLPTALAPAHTWYVAHEGRCAQRRKAVYHCFTKLCLIEKTDYYTTVMFG